MMFSKAVVYMQVAEEEHHELISSDMNYTVLVLSRREVHDMKSLLKQGFIDMKQVSDNLLLHVLPGRYEIEYLQELAAQNRYGGYKYHCLRPTCGTFL